MRRNNTEVDWGFGSYEAKFLRSLGTPCDDPNCELCAIIDRKSLEMPEGEVSKYDQKNEKDDSLMAGYVILLIAFHIFGVWLGAVLYNYLWR